MKKIIVLVLLACISLMAVEGTKSWSPDIDGTKLYKQRCALCHGVDAHKIPAEGIAPLAGRDVVKLALDIQSYRDQDNDIGSYTMHKSSQLMKDATVNLSGEDIVALAKYISNLK